MGNGRRLRKRVRKSKKLNHAVGVQLLLVNKVQKYKRSKNKNSCKRKTPMITKFYHWDRNVKEYIFLVINWANTWGTWVILNSHNNGKYILTIFLCQALFYLLKLNPPNNFMQYVPLLFSPYKVTFTVPGEKKGIERACLFNQARGFGSQAFVLTAQCQLWIAKNCQREWWSKNLLGCLKGSKYNQRNLMRGRRQVTAALQNHQTWAWDPSGQGQD